MTTTTPLRDYAPLRTLTPRDTTAATMAALNDALWQHFARRTDGDRGISWLGFYFAPHHTFTDPTGLTLTPADDEMLLGPCLDRPACSPIGLHGACGSALTTATTLVVTHVRNLGPNYVPCDPRDTAELVVPLFNDRGSPYAVFDADAFDPHAFAEHDARAIEALLIRLGLSHPPRDTPIKVI